MLNETTMREAMQAYIDRFNAQDLAGIVALYSDEATLEDPVGSPPKSGRAQIQTFYKAALETGAKLTLATPIRASHGNAAAMAFDVRLSMAHGPSMIRVIDVMTFNAAGQFTSMRAYWGPGDMQPVD